MRLQTYFKRDKGASVNPTLGVTTDPEPVFSTGAPAGKDNVLAVSRVAGSGVSIHRIIVGYRFEDGADGAGVDLVGKLWAWDMRSSRWYLASTHALKDGQLAAFEAPTLAEPPPTSANLNAPTAGGAQFMLTVADPGAGAASGTYHFVMGPDTANY